MFSRLLRTQKLQIITYNVHKGPSVFQKALCCPKAIFMMNKAIHTGQINHAARQIVYKEYVKPAYEDHDHKNMRLKRPMSPHLFDYAPTLPAMTSIGQRISGAIVAFYCVMLAAGSLFLSNGIDTYVSMIQSLNLSRISVFLLKLIIGFPFSYHFFIGLRFVGFSLLKFVDIKSALKTARICVILSLISTFFFALR
ncbi:hypothetical protein MSG28_009562 [Choristoneura fumiferana]|uniref:Uncharacterized protein n=1 Tax=Choristoneura fumiferana TaxID=7141 RepID=A0ACC0JBL1_CHOFU|nr:hypothetical protein MSG28_009562 [Choristoneura fumiferana]